MKKEIPLSLQVFHSRNEYKAHRLNHTEQLRLDGVRSVLDREEKLFMKGHKLHKSRFTAQHNKSGDSSSLPVLYSDRRNSVSSCVFSHNFSHLTTSRTSITSAPPKYLGTHRGNKTQETILQKPIASQLRSSLGRVSNSSKFARVQRQFSLASFTKNGTITKRGKVMSKNIPKARNILFKTSSSPCGVPNNELNESQNEDTYSNDDETNSRRSPTRPTQSENRSIKDEFDFTDSSNTAGTHNNKSRPTSCVSIHNNKSRIKSSTNKESVPLMNTSSDENVPAAILISENDLSALKTDTCSQQTHKLDYINSWTDESVHHNRPKSSRKRVTIKQENNNYQTTKPNTKFVENIQRQCSDLDDFVEDSQHVIMRMRNNEFDKVSQREKASSSCIIINSSSYSTPPTTTTRPNTSYNQGFKLYNRLQDRVNSFLSDQTIFNQTFPKGGGLGLGLGDKGEGGEGDGGKEEDEAWSEMMRVIQTQLLHKAKERKEMEKNELKRKNEIIQHVLHRLGVKDPHIMSLYGIGG